MKSLTVRLPEELVAEIETESREAGLSKSDVVRRRLQMPSRDRARSTQPTFHDLAADVIGIVKEDDLPRDLSGRKKHYLQRLGYGRNRRR